MPPNPEIPQTQPSRVLASMLDRLYSAIMTGPAMNCRPNNSRQRIDLQALFDLGDTPPAHVLLSLLGTGATSTINANVPAPASAKSDSKRRFRRSPAVESEATKSADDQTDTSPQRIAWNQQQAVLTKLRHIASEAETYEQDTGVDVLHLGFPVVSIPPGVPGPDGAPTTRRILAPICLLPLSIEIKGGAKASLELSCSKDDVDRVQPNQALLAWIEQSRKMRGADLFADEEGANPWREICEQVAFVARALDLPAPAVFTGEVLPAELPLQSTPKRDAEGDTPSIVCAAVLGLFPASNQGLLRDTREMMDLAELKGPVRAFVRREPTVLEEAPTAPAIPQRLVSNSDPCQAQAVALARTSPVLVIHGPPGTGKSQTITNIIGDHLARGERVLFVCDKRTAIDVVANRLDAIGLGSLCAVVHDPQKDQKTLYLSLRAQLDALSETATNPAAVEQLAALDREAETLYAELTEYHTLLMTASAPGGSPLTELVGKWLTLRGPATDAVRVEDALLGHVAPAQIDASLVSIRELLDRAGHVDFPAHPWRDAAGVSLDAFLGRPRSQHRQAIADLVAIASEADAAIPKSPVPAPLAIPIAEVARSRRELAVGVTRVIAAAPQPIRVLWADSQADTWNKAQSTLQAVDAAAESLQGFVPDQRVMATLAATGPTLGALAPEIAAVEQYLAIAAAWWSVFAMGRKAAAARALARLGLTLSIDQARIGLVHLKAQQAALIVRDALAKVTPESVPVADPVSVRDLYVHHITTLDCLMQTAATPATRDCLPGVREDLRRPGGNSCELAAAHAEALTRLSHAAVATGLFDRAWLQSSITRCSSIGECTQLFRSLTDSMETLEDCLRVRASLQQIPSPLSSVVEQLALTGTESAIAIKFITRGVLHAEILRRLESAPRLKAADARRIDALFTRMRELDAQRQELTRQVVIHHWVGLCRKKLLVATQSRLNSDGAAVKQRLFVKGSRAMRLRQVIAFGAKSEGGDPLFDLRPIWMASPETVAQIFPRIPLFDAVIFDEASQVRLEEALPVLTRARRIIIAGDPKQLPPTRFFESATAEARSEPVETDSDLFEQVQSDTEDLLSAALSMDIDQSYLDVHYRSRNADLIEFSNQNFYATRLQAIPGHPRRRGSTPPLELHEVEGVYEDRANQIEAQAVVDLIRTLLKQSSPPSIGVGCFNISQRDTISDLLDETAAEDKDFAAQLATARSRRSSASFEGLFVKNLENVQGDERDVIIISTTYGPDPAGKFYRRFGPLGQPGGGRRLNVLVTRARERVYIVTSIPPSVYAGLPPVPEGVTPGGAYLLFSYLAFARALRETYERADQADSCRRSEELVHRRATGRPSPLPEAMADQLAERDKLSSTVYWGNDGFCIDIATPSPDAGNTAPLGVLTDFSRFGVGDPVKWDIFRSGILKQQGWELERIWTPTLVRDPDQAFTRIAQKARPGTRT